MSNQFQSFANDENDTTSEGNGERLFISIKPSIEKSMDENQPVYWYTSQSLPNKNSIFSLFCNSDSLSFCCKKRQLKKEIELT